MFDIKAYLCYVPIVEHILITVKVTTGLNECYKWLTLIESVF